jgi:hypothetical protein
LLSLRQTDDVQLSEVNTYFYSVLEHTVQGLRDALRLANETRAELLESK